MKDYYGTLDITRSATLTEIKKAYFTLVRKFPPERYPQEFMRIREAYEVLIDENTRRQYDLVDSMPAVVKAYFEEGSKALNEGDTGRAIRLLEEVRTVYPNFSVVNSLLGDAYLANGNSVKAIRIFENLAALEQTNAGFVRRLAQAYTRRGWYRKAIDQYRRALTLDEDNISLWLGLIDCYLETDDPIQAQETVWEGLEVSNRKGWNNLELYYHIIQIDIYSHDLINMKKHLGEMKTKALEKEEEKDHVAWFLAVLAKQIHKVGLYEQAAETIETAFALMPDNEELLNIKKEIDAQSAIHLQLRELEEDSTIDSQLPEMLAFELQMCDDKFCVECIVGQFFHEMEIITAIEPFRPQILRLKKNYPALYELKKEFFNNVINSKKEDHLLNAYRKKYKKLEKLYPEKFAIDDDEEYGFEPPQPYVRPEPKIGRNDPCPCGSGKKYKKCCGA